MQFSNRWSPAFALLIVVGCGQPNVYQEPPPPKVKVASPVVQTVTDYLEETATTEAVAKVEVRARVQGFLNAVNFEPGSDVKAGDLLYEIEPDLYQAQVASANADVLAQEARLKKANLDKERQERIRAQDSGATSEAAVITAVAEFEAATAAVQQAQAVLRQSEIDNNYTKILAPIDGRVGKTLVKQGNLVGSGGESTMLTTVINYDPIYANFSISEPLLLRLRDVAADRNTGRIDNAQVPIFLSRDNDKDFPFEGHFDYADLAVDQSTGTFMIRGIFPNPSREILPGLFVTVRLPISKHENAVLIPSRAVTIDQAGKFALVVNAENEVERRPVTLGTSVGDLVVITEGLTAEDTVIIEGLQRARPGAKVNPQQIELEGGTTPAETVQSVGTQPPESEAESVDVQGPTSDGDADSGEATLTKP